jgi:hypothetical protein
MASESIKTISLTDIGVNQMPWLAQQQPVNAIQSTPKVIVPPPMAPVSAPAPVVVEQPAAPAPVVIAPAVAPPQAAHEAASDESVKHGGAASDGSDDDDASSESSGSSLSSATATDLDDGEKQEGGDDSDSDSDASEDVKAMFDKYFVSKSGRSIADLLEIIAERLGGALPPISRDSPSDGDEED